MVVSLVDTNNVDLRRRLIAAGYMSPEAPKLFTLFRLVLTFALPAIFVITSLRNPEPPTALTLYMVASLLAVLGLYMPNLYISAKASRRQRSEEHTSELQSLMRISYAVFFLKKKTHKKLPDHNNH